MPSSEATSSDLWIIGFGNAQRRDDGIGPYVVTRLQPVFECRSDVHLLVLQQLEPDVIDALKTADTILFVDASLEALPEGRQWVGLQPELKAVPCLSHQVSPSFILWLLQCVYQRNPAGWLVSVEGNDFSSGFDLSSEAQKRAEQAIGDIAEFVLSYGEEPESITRINRKNS